MTTGVCAAVVAGFLGPSSARARTRPATVEALAGLIIVFAVRAVPIYPARDRLCLTELINRLISLRTRRRWNKVRVRFFFSYSLRRFFVGGWQNCW